MRRVLSSEDRWKVSARMAIRNLPAGWVGTSQDIRLQLSRSGIERPHHHNCWGALINACVNDGLLVWTGRMDTAKIKKSHARAVKVYRKGETATERMRREL